jgi:hypothetical protein
LTLDVPNRTTQAAIEEGRRIARGPAEKGDFDMAALKAALES